MHFLWFAEPLWAPKGVDMCDRNKFPGLRRVSACYMSPLVLFGLMIPPVLYTSPTGALPCINGSLLGCH